MSYTKLISPSDGAEVNLNAPFQKDFYECKKFREVKKVIKKLIKAKKDDGFFTIPEPVRFRWETDEENSVLEISETADFSCIEKIECTEAEKSVYNLKKNTQYFWRVNGSEVCFFRTDSVTPRWLYADGIVNFRDLGAEKTKDGKTVRQGLIFRGIKLEDKITPDGIETFRNLGIRSEIDLRKEAEGKLTECYAGSDIKYIFHVCNGYEDFLNDPPERTAQLIGYFADESNYPVYFHCHGGADRTGTLAFMLGAILGLDDETLLRNYELTMICSPEKKMSRSRKGKIKKFLKILQGRDKNKSIGENTVDFLRESGVTDEVMKKIRSIMLTDCR